MTDEELLAEAYRRYPIGTRFLSTISDNGTERVVEPYYENKYEMEYKVIEGNSIYARGGMKSGKETCSNPRLYKNGEWCPIVEEILNYEIF